MATDAVTSGNNEFEMPPRKKPKVSELPLSSVQRASIDGMLHTFKKKGEFDALRKKAFQQYNESAQRGMFEAALRTFTINEIEREPVKYLKPDRRMGAPLLEGAAARANVYVQTETDVDTYINQYLETATRALREIRRKEIGDAAADEEIQRGNMSDEAYAAQAEERRNARAKQHVEEERLRRKQEAQERKKKELDALRKKQDELMKETERLQREQKRRAEREAWKAAEKERERERIRKYNEEREQQKKQAEERELAARMEKEQRQKERAEREQKRLEQDALDLLLREGEKMAEKAKRPELERSESMEPPPRLTKHSSAPRNSMSRDEMRAQGLMPTSMTLRKDKAGAPAPPTGPRASMAQASMPVPDDDRRRPSRAMRSPSPGRSNYGRRRETSPPRDGDRRSRREEPRRESLYRDISAQRGAWRSRQRPRDASRGEEGEVVERASTRARSRSRDSFRRRRDTPSPPRRRYREDTRSRSPPRFRSRRDSPPRRRDSPPRRRDSPPRRKRSPDSRRARSRSPPGIDRYIPGGAVAVGPAVRRRDDGNRERERDRDRDRDRERDRERRRRDDDDRDDRRRKETRYSDRPSAADADRYIPGGGGGGRANDTDKPARTERSRSRDRDRRHREKSRERDANRDQAKELEKEGDGKEPAQERESQAEEQSGKNE